MKRRQFIFRSAQGASFLLPVLSMRKAESEMAELQRLMVFVETGSYPYPEDFFPATAGTNFLLPPILRDFGDLRQDMVIVDGIDIRESGPNPRGNNHLRSIGKLLTAKDIIAIREDPDDALIGGISVDEVIRRQWNARSIELQIHTQQYRHIRSQPFGLGARQFKFPEANPALAYDAIFRNFVIPQAGTVTAPPLAAIRQLNARKSVLDGLLEDLSRFRNQLDGLEKLKLDIHEDAVRTAERSVAQELADLENPADRTTVSSQCAFPQRNSSSSIPVRSQAHFDLIYAALVCNRARIANLIFSYSSPIYRYEWINLGIALSSNIHNQVYHNRANERARHIQATRWNWNELAKFLRRLKSTPEGAGTMLDNTLVYGTSHFGLHHELERIPVVFFGNVQGRLVTGRSLKLSGGPHTNAKALCSLGRLCGLSINGMGDEPNSGPIPGLV